MPLISSIERRRRIGWAFILFVLLYSGYSSLSAQEPVTKEYQVKAVFLFNFAQFVQWPSDNFKSPTEPFCIGVLGENPFGTFLDGTVQGEKVNGHPMIVQHYNSIDEVKKCEILFISASESEKIKGILDSLKDRSVLTVGDFKGFVDDGGMVRFFMEDNKIHLRINVGVAQQAHLSISSKILRLAEIVDLGGK